MHLSIKTVSALATVKAFKRKPSQHQKLLNIIILSVSFFCTGAKALELASPDIADGKTLTVAQVLDGFGCHGGNQSPALQWSAAPAATKSFAVTIYDPDAPTGSGWWHWVVYDIPATVTSLAAGVGGNDMPATIGKQARNDFGSYSFGGACPPAGDKPHRYIVTIYALKTTSLNVPADASPALIGFSLHGETLAKKTITGLYSR
ncbi:MAG: YbhB/YbcL family Raf kinase inhibitor-like protein [Verrucomicrobiaceae bacterium]|nr:YbhB/YbcL family Raf kinase inhibitor-like protein [Verrucomicrobiaceae bacterium]